jgi:chromosome segregation ATPase
MQNSRQEKTEEVTAKLGDVIEQLDEIIEHQSKLLKSTEQFRERLTRDREQKQSAGYKEFLEKQLARIREIRGHLKMFKSRLELRVRGKKSKAADPGYLPQMAFGLEENMRQSLDELKGDLEKRNPESALLRAEESRNLLERLRANGEAIERFHSKTTREAPKVDALGPLDASLTTMDKILADLKELLQQKSLPLNQADQKEMNRLREGQEGIRERSLKIDDRLDGLSKELPFLSEKFLGEEKGDARQPEMKQAAERLRKSDISNAIPNERSALFRLQEARENLQKALEQAQKSGEPSQGLSLPAFGPRQKSAPGQQFGGRGTEEEKVEIPGKEAYQVPQQFRRDVLDAMKKPAPKGYEKLNREYYEKLVE